VAVAVRLRARWPLPMGPAVAVLGWHRIDFEGGRLAVPPQLFARQMDILGERRHRVPVVQLDQVRAVLAAGTLRARGVVLTFDDAWADNHAHALGPLSRLRLPATLYAPSHLLGKPGYMTRTQLLEMDAGGVTIGAHSQEDLEDLLGKPVASFAYPTGLFDERVVAAVGAAGFSTAMTTRPGWWRPVTRALQIPRSFVGDFSDATYLAAIAGGLNVLGPLDAIKRLSHARGGRP
jgi:peptidoglycan/xylan/chitin deacetylase (PgdA/CDA1 family)